ncbi:hypothetical protein [Pseudomonas brassicacearum]|nr:hypothetical protein [Pseudomonas brassicacearum]
MNAITQVADWTLLDDSQRLLVIALLPCTWWSSGQMIRLAIGT